MRHAAALSLALFTLAACESDRATGPLPSDRSALASNAGGNEERAGTVYTLGNQAAGNAVLAFARAADGSLAPAGSFATGGNGTGAGLGSQNAIVFSRDGRFLFAVNAGSDEVSSFRITSGGLELVGTVPSGGIRPISVTAARGLLYVLNAGGAGNISGFTVSERGALTPLAGSTRALSSGAANPAQIEFDPKARHLIVTEKATNLIGTYRIDRKGLPSSGVFTPSSGQTPFGFAFRRDVLIVSEAFGGAVDASAASSYEIGKSGSLAVISASVPTTETAACWFVVTGDGRYAYATNTGSGSITGYAVSSSGSLSRLDADGKTGITGAGSSPIDVAVSRNSRYLYSLNSGTETIAAFLVKSDGSLEPVAGGASGLPDGAVGLIAK